MTTTYKVRGPDGQVYLFAGPDNATPDQVTAAASAHFSGAPPAFNTTSHIPAPDASASGNPYDKDAGGVMGGIYSAAHGIENGATLGFGDRAAALLASKLSGKSFDESLADIKARAQTADNAHPYISTIANVAGMVPAALAGGEVAAGARAAIPLAERGAAMIDAAHPIVQSIIRNVARVGTGAGVGAVQGYNDSGTSQGAVTGAEFGGAAAPFGAAAGRLLGGAKNAAFNLIAKHVKLPGETLAQATSRIASTAADYVKQFGHNPTIAELLHETQGREIAATISHNSNATALAAANEEVAGHARQADLAGALSRGGPSPAAQNVRQAASDHLDKVMTKIGDDQIPITPEQKQVLEDENVQKALGGPAYKATKTALGDVLSGDATSLSIRDLETMRNALARGADTQDRVVGKHFGDLRDFVSGIAEQHPEYKAAMRQVYQPAMRYAQAMDDGAKALGSGVLPKDATAAFTNLDAKTPVGRAEIGGQRAGVRGKFAADAQQGPNAAASLANDLTNNEGLRSKVTAIMSPQEADSMLKAGELAYKSGRGIASVVPGSKTKAAQQAQQTAQAIRAATLGLHGGSSAFLAHTIEHLTSMFSLPVGTARKLAELATDPRKTPAVMQYLKARGGSAAMRRQFLTLLRNQVTGTQAAGQIGGMLGAMSSPTPDQLPPQ